VARVRRLSKELADLGRQLQDQRLGLLTSFSK
jgi:hypothetical protein